MINNTFTICQMISTNRYALAERSGGERLVKAEEKIEKRSKLIYRLTYPGEQKAGS